MLIPHTALDPSTLQSLVEDFASRDGTDYGETELSLSEKVERIKQMLEQGKIAISFDPDTESCALHTIIPWVIYFGIAWFFGLNTARRCKISKKSANLDQ